jgi:hypothetical protein
MSRATLSSVKFYRYHGGLYSYDDYILLSNPASGWLSLECMCIDEGSSRIELFAVLREKTVRVQMWWIVVRGLQFNVVM